ncbi:Uba4p NDAI_0B05570 [Naumovozyma dairenensis CBS 421]|uniref:Needs CLA4 to survive protein 3 n=1 Tax=Naumovozyma dairenensis (strain ATCC 10597 / BCRC 20456 / CBS 421 / NBRC 0211 / NRRL Y-12639) TaxID=1071378 RepID=G0W729_NAUDC|nr:hypothetical protein NDAI_0B05570 [Naumovozyma dairenensis CBS 421]CCD23590.1 hypothetical protein NDAI_0B05570 [Naumovozyma dairenensis CBS 421]
MSDQELLAQIRALKLENEALKVRLSNTPLPPSPNPLSLEEYNRYGRQMIVDMPSPIESGLPAQLKLKSAKILIIGAGGLGSPALLYLAGAGVGTIGIVDNDIVDTSNLHRQIIHDSHRVNMLKCESAKLSIQNLNPNVNVVTYPTRLTHSNAFEIFEGYDLILDCTDTPLTRYLISDVAVKLGITVVSGSGVGTEAQLTILNFMNMGPCYRCFFPVPPPPTSVASCSEGGVIGPCIGVMGVMMAVEAIKFIVGAYTVENFEPYLVLYSGFPGTSSGQSMRTFKMRRRQKNCACCSNEPSITKESIESGSINYELFCGSRNYNVCQADERISVHEFDSAFSPRDTERAVKENLIMLDVRPNHHYNISHLPDTVNIPLKVLKNMNGSMELLQEVIPTVNTESEVIVLCRYGNDSQLATRLLKDEFKIGNVKDVKGGFFKYIDELDTTIPKY